MAKLERVAVDRENYHGQKGGGGGGCSLFSFGSQYPSFLSFLSLTPSFPPTRCVVVVQMCANMEVAKARKKVDTGYGGGRGGNANICASLSTRVFFRCCYGGGFFPWAKRNRSRRIGRKEVWEEPGQRREREDEDMMMRRRGSGLLFFPARC